MRDLIFPVEHDGELGLQTLLGLSLAAAEGFGAPGVARVFARASEICREVGETEALAPILFGQWIFYFTP